MKRIFLFVICLLLGYAFGMAQKPVTHNSKFAAPATPSTAKSANNENCGSGYDEKTIDCRGSRNINRIPDDQGPNSKSIAAGNRVPSSGGRGSKNNASERTSERKGSDNLRSSKSGHIQL